MSCDKRLALAEINTLLAKVDVAIVAGANDVVTPDARNKKHSSIDGVPIFQPDFAGRTC